MYLLDNKVKYNKNFILKISEAKTEDDLKNILDLKQYDEINYFFKKIEYSIKNTSYKNKSKSLKKNIINLFEGEPLKLNISENQDISYMLNKLEDKDFKLNKFMIEISKIYQDKLLKKIEKKEITCSHFEFVGSITKNFNKLFYGNGKINKYDMDNLLFGLQKNIESKPIEQEERDKKIKELSLKIKLIANDLNVYPENPVEVENPTLNEYIREISKKLSSNNIKDKILFLNNKKLIKKEIKLNKNIKDYEAIKSELKEKFQENQNIIEYLDKTNKFSDLKIKDLYDFTKNKKNLQIREEFNKIYKELIDLKEPSIMEKNLNNNIKINSKLEKKDYGLFNKKNSLDKIKNFDNKLLQESLSYLKKYSFKEVKEYLLFRVCKNKDLYQLSSKSNVLSNLKGNRLILNNINEHKNERFLYLYNILVNKENIDKLFTTDIRINIKDKFYEKLGLTIDSELGEYKLNELYKIFKEKQENLNYQNSNILLGTILEAYIDKKFDENRFQELFNIIKTPIKNFKEKDKKIVNEISDKWLKWSICYNREIQDNNLVFSNINPLDFDFSKFKTIQKIYEETFNRLPNRLEVGISNFVFNNMNINEFKEFIIKYEEKIIKSQTNDKLRRFLNLINYNIGLLNDSFINNKLNKYIENIKKDFLSNDYKSISKLINVVELKNFINNPLLENYLNNIEKILPIITLLKNKDIKESFLEDENLFKNFIENNYIVKMSERTIIAYLKYYKKLSESTKFKEFKEEDCLIPIIEKEIGNGYKYKIKTIKDFDILLTGEKTNCCMTFGHAGFNIYQYMYENPKENVIFEVYKDNKPVANSWTWIKDNKICFDNIEVLGNEIRDNIIKAYQDAALEFVINYNIDFVGYGVNHSDVDTSLMGNRIMTKIKNDHLNCYTDSENQSGIFCNFKNKEISNIFIDLESMKNKIKNVNKDLYDKFLNSEINEKENIIENKKNNLTNIINSFIGL